MHYCCGKLDKVSLSSKISKACKFETPGHNTVHSKNCCDNKTYEFKIKADQETSSQQIASFELQPINTLLAIERVRPITCEIMEIFPYVARNNMHRCALVKFWWRRAYAK